MPRFASHCAPQAALEGAGSTVAAAAADVSGQRTPGAMEWSASARGGRPQSHSARCMQARTRLPYEAFAAFLQNIKDLNTGRQSREQTLERARSIFGDSNGDLYLSFQALLARHLSN
jgi:hypothetical protein